MNTLILLFFSMFLCSSYQETISLCVEDNSSEYIHFNSQDRSTPVHTFLSIPFNKKQYVIHKAKPIQELEIIQIEYKASSRGTFMQINIDKNFIKKSTDRTLKHIDSKKCSKTDWDMIMSLIKDIRLDHIGDLKMSSNKRHTDAALHAQLKVISRDSIYTSASFDHGNPPKEIKLLVNTILSLSESIE